MLSHPKNKKTSSAGIEPAIPRSVVWCVSIAPRAQYTHHMFIRIIYKTRQLNKQRKEEKNEWNKQWNKQRMKERNNERMGVFIKEYLYLYLSYCHFDYTKTKNKIKLFKNKTFYLLVLLKLSFCMFIFCKALIAQSVEHGANNARVAGSKPAESIFIIYNHRREKEKK